MSNPFSQARDMYALAKKAKEIQKELKDTEIEAKNSDGSVVAVFNGEQHLKSIHISDEIFQPGKKLELERQLTSVVSQGISKAQAVAADQMKAVAGDLGLKIPGM